MWSALEHQHMLGHAGAWATQRDIPRERQNQPRQSANAPVVTAAQPHGDAFSPQVGRPCDDVSSSPMQERHACASPGQALNSIPGGLIGKPGVSGKSVRQEASHHPVVAQAPTAVACDNAVSNPKGLPSTAKAVISCNTISEAVPEECIKPAACNAAILQCSETSDHDEDLQQAALPSHVSQRGHSDHEGGDALAPAIPGFIHPSNVDGRNGSLSQLGGEAAMLAGPPRGSSCSVPRSRADELRISGIFQGASGHSGAHSHKGGCTRKAAATRSSGRLSVHGNTVHAADAVLPGDDSHSQWSEDDSGNGELTPKAVPARYITCMGSAPARVCCELDIPISCAPGLGALKEKRVFPEVHVPEGVRGVGVPRAMSVDSYREDLRAISHEGLLAPSGPCKASAGHQPFPEDSPENLRNMAEIFQQTLQDDFCNGVSNVNLSEPVSCGTRPTPQTSSQLPRSREVGPGGVPASQPLHGVSNVESMRHMAGPNVLARIAGSSLPPGRAALPSWEIPWDQRFEDPESSDEAPLQPQAQNFAMPASPAGPMAKQLQRRSAHAHQQASEHADGSNPAAGTPRGHRLESDPHTTARKEYRLASQRSTDGPEACQSHHIEQEVDRPRLAAAPLRSQQSRPRKSFQGSQDSPCKNLRSARVVTRAGAAGCTQPPECAAPALKRARKRAGTPPADGAQGAVAQLPRKRARRRYEPCSEHVEGIFPGRVVCPGMHPVPAAFAVLFHLPACELRLFLVSVSEKAHARHIHAFSGGWASFDLTGRCVNGSVPC